MIDARRPTGGGDGGGDGLCAIARLRIDDSRSGETAHGIDHLGFQALARVDGVADIGPVEPGDNQPRIGNTQLRQDVGAGVRVRRGGEREARGIAEGIEQRAQQAVVRAEIMPPFGNAMRLVDGEQRDSHLPQQIEKRRLRGAFGRDVEQVEIACQQPLDGLGAVAVGACQCRGADSDRLCAAQLIVHQRDQRRDDDGRPVEQHRRQLIGQRFARAGRHDGERVLAGEDAGDDALLHPPESGEAEDAVEGFCGVGGDSHAGASSRSTACRAHICA